MQKLFELTKVLRSKNSGPFALTIDLLFDSERDYRRVQASGVISRETFCSLYRLRPEDLREIVFFDRARGIKITFNRSVPSGSAGDRDVYGAQQHAPLLDLMIPDELPEQT